MDQFGKQDDPRSEEEFKPAYLHLYHAGGLERRRDLALASLARCRGCPRNCEVDRLVDKTSVCRTGRYAQVASFFPHFGEEDCLRGWRGSGTIFFSNCNLRCVFCQNFDLSQGVTGRVTPPGRLAEMMLELQSVGCHNINLVTPEHVVPQILEALAMAIPAGLRIPLVYNTSAYDALESLAWLDGIVDIYMPDFKIWGSKEALRYLKAEDYPEIARRAILEMHRQVGPLTLDDNGLARRGVLVRHLVMPDRVAGTPEILKFLAESLSPDTYVNLMAQYRPAGRVTGEKYAEINRPVTRPEYQKALAMARAHGLRLDQRKGRW